MKIHKIAYRKRGEDKFDYSEEIREMWRELVHKEKDRINVGFDLENDDGYETKTKDLEYRSKNGNKFRVNARICWAGGDWEAPICYFKCQFQERSYFEHDDSWGQWRDCIKAIIIPKKANPNLMKSEKDPSRLVAKGGDDGVGSTDINEKDLWKEMQKIAEERVKKYFDEYLSYSGDFRYNNVGAVRNLLEAYKK